MSRLSGRVWRTSLRGGVINEADSGARWHFVWRDCVNANPSNLGHGVIVKFTPSRGERAVDVELLNGPSAVGGLGNL